jgi:HK97 family phage major capsid protein
VAYDNLISRTDASALIPEEVSNSIIKAMPKESAAMTLFRQVRMARGQERLPVVSALPVAYFVTGDTGLKQTTEVNWANTYLIAEEIAVIVPVPDAVLEDAAFDVWAEIQPMLVEAFGRTLDAAVFFGTNKPTSWPDSIATAVAAASHTYTRGTNNAAAGGIVEDVNQVMGLVEGDGYEVTGFATRTSYKARFRGARDSTGQPLMDNTTGSLYGIPVGYFMAGQFSSGTGAAELFALDRRQFILGIRSDIKIRRFTEGVIQDGSGAIQYNLMQQDMTAVRLTMRVAWQVANPETYDQPTDASRYPAAALVSP